MSQQVPRALPAVMRKAPKGVTDTTSREWTSAVTMSLTLDQQLAIQQLLFGASEPSHTLSEAIERYQVAARVLGHASTGELQRYQHARVEDSRQAILAVAQKIGGKR